MHVIGEKARINKSDTSIILNDDSNILDLVI
jgi:hypothetical protein